MSEQCAGSGQPGNKVILYRTATCRKCRSHFYSENGWVPDHKTPEHKPYDHPYGDLACAACHEDWPCNYERGRAAGAAAERAVWVAREAARDAYANESGASKVSVGYVVAQFDRLLASGSGENESGPAEKEQTG